MNMLLLAIQLILYVKQ